MNALKSALVALFVLSGSHASAGTSPKMEAPVLNWSSSNEAGVYGYVVYRATDPKGPFLRINPRIIPRDAEASDRIAGSGNKTSKYQYVDQSANPALTNYYYIDAIGDSGRKKRLTGVVSKPPPAPGPQD